MKEKNQYYSKNVEHTVIFFNPEGPIKKKDLELLDCSQNGDFNSLTQLITKREYKSEILNCALANMIQNFKQDESFYNCFKLLLSTNINFNYKFSQEQNKTLLMKVISKNDIKLLQIFLESIINKIKAIKILPSDKMEEYQISEIKKIFSQTDNFGNNFSHLFTSFDKKELFKYFSFFYDKLGDYGKSFSNGIQSIIQHLFLEKNNEGNTIMSLSLENNYIEFVFKLLSINGYKPNVNIKNNNLIHSAVLGKSISGVKIMLYYCNEEDLTMKNDDSITPAQLANKLCLYTINNIINEYQNNFKEKEYKKHFYKNSEIFKNKIINLKEDLLTNFNNMKYKEILFELKELKIIYEISNDNNNINQTNKNEENILYRISLYKLEWNIIECKMNLNSDTNEKEKDKLNDIYKTILDFYYNNITKEFIISLINTIKQLKQIPKEQNNDENEILYPSYINIDKSFAILIYNKIIFYFKIGSYKSLLETANIYFKEKYIPENALNDIDITDKKRFILFVNISCILIEILISQGYKNLSQVIIKALDRYLFKIRSLFSEKIDHYTPWEISVFKYLSKNGILHPYSAYFSEIFCYTNYLKLMNNKEKNKDKEYFSQIKKLLNDSIYDKEPTAFDRLGSLYPFLEMKKIYEKDKEENKIYNLLNGIYYNEENNVYYLNAIGIIFLKKQKYNLSKFFFIKGYFIYKQNIKNRRDKFNKFYNFRIDIITAFLYNISLCYFYMKEYIKCITILECILNFNSNKNNFFINYRLALCYYYLYMESCNKNSDYFNKNIIKLIGYEKIKNYKKRENIKQLSIELDNEGIIYNLSQKFEAEHKKKSLKDKQENKFSFHQSDKNVKSDKVQYKYNNIYKIGKNLVGNNSLNSNTNIKKIILKKSTQLLHNNNTNILFHNKKIYETEKLEYLNKAIKYFKRVIHISKLNEINIISDSMKSLFEFYSSYMEEEKPKDNSDIDEYFSISKKIPNELLINSYFNLLLCLSIKKNWPEMILIIKDYYNRDIISNKIIELKIWLYELEAYINIKNGKKIKEIISKIKKFKKIDLSLLNKTDNDVINNINIKLYIYFTLTRIYIEEKNFKEMDVNIKKILFLIKDVKNIPYYITDLLLNVYIIKLNNETNINKKTKYAYNNIILNLIKNKKTNEE